MYDKVKAVIPDTDPKLIQAITEWLEGEVTTPDRPFDFLTRARIIAIRDFSVARGVIL